MRSFGSTRDKDMKSTTNTIVDDDESSTESHEFVNNTPPAPAENAAPPVTTESSGNAQTAQPQLTNGAADIDLIAQLRALAQMDQVMAQNASAGGQLGQLLSAATPGSSLAATLAACPNVLDSLWELQEIEEEQIRNQRAALMQLTPPGFEPPNPNPTNNGEDQAPPSQT